MTQPNIGAEFWFRSGVLPCITGGVWGVLAPSRGVSGHFLEWKTHMITTAGEMEITYAGERFSRFVTRSNCCAVNKYCSMKYECTPQRTTRIVLHTLILSIANITVIIY